MMSTDTWKCRSDTDRRIRRGARHGHPHSRAGITARRYGAAVMSEVAVSVVVPVLDEVEALPGVHEELLAALGELATTAELIYVDDGSTDGTTELLAKLAAERPDLVRVGVLRRNYGKSAALAAGFDLARGDRVVMMDADGQDVPSELPKLLDAADAGGLDVVCGWRAQRDDRAAKRLQSRLYNLTTRTLTGVELHDFNTGYKLMHRDVVDELPMYGEFHRFLPVLAADLGFRVGEVAVTHRPRQAGTSKFTSALRLPKTLLDLLTVVFLTRFADRPLHLFGGVGATLSAVGVVILAYLSALWFAGEGIGQRPLLFLGVLLVLVGVQLFSVGFLGDVLRHTRSREQRPYRLRTRHDAVADAADDAARPGDGRPSDGR